VCGVGATSPALCTATEIRQNKSFFAFCRVRLDAANGEAQSLYLAYAAAVLLATAGWLVTVRRPLRLASLSARRQHEAVRSAVSGRARGVMLAPAGREEEYRGSDYAHGHDYGPLGGYI
jgi:hypothetical protein